MGLPTQRDIQLSNSKFKARVVTKGFRQEYGVNFGKLFSPVVKMKTLRFLLHVVAIEDLEFIQLDVKMAFLHNDVEGEIYMKQSKGLDTIGQEHLVC